MRGWEELAVAFALFFASHLILVRPAIRERLIDRVGRVAYLSVYSVISLLLFGWLIAAAGRAPYVALWDYSP